jgi:hypothetical protein
VALCTKSRGDEFETEFHLPFPKGELMSSICLWRLMCTMAMGATFMPAQIPQERPVGRDPVSAQERDTVPLRNWAAPLYFKPKTVQTEERLAAPGVSPAPTPRPELSFPGTEDPLTFVAMNPCRLVDTRAGTTPAFPPGLGPPSLPAATPRNFVFPPGACNIPAESPGPQAYSFNVTVIPIAGASPKGGYLTIYPGTGANPATPPLDASLVWQGSTVYLSNAVIVASNSNDGSIYVYANQATDIVIDINGYYAPPTLGTNTALGYQALPSSEFGSQNTAVGAQALHADTIGSANTAIGFQALMDNTRGLNNTAAGFFALQSNTLGGNNTANGFQALVSNTVGSDNTAAGFAALGSNLNGDSNSANGSGALSFNTAGTNNTAMGYNALNKATGGNNTGLGAYAGSAVTTGSYNIEIGPLGASADDHVIRVGDVQTMTFIAGISGTTTANSDAVAVVVDSKGQLGTINSSGRFKEDIQDMADASSGLLRLRPVTYRYKQAYADGSKPIDYGLIAEEVAEVYPDLVVKGANGLVQTVQYQKLTPMLLNELQKQNLQSQGQREIIQRQQEEIQGLEARLAALERLLSGAVTVQIPDPALPPNGITASARPSFLSRPSLVLPHP